MHDEIIQFVDSIAANIKAPVPTPTQGQEEMESSLTTSPFVSRVRIPFGRRTGIVYGEPTIELRSNEVADALLSIPFSELYDDYRRKMGFQEVAPTPHRSAESVEAQEEEEDRRALETMEVDRYLLDPDVLYDMKKMRQNRLLTSSQKINVPSFLVNDESDTVKSQDLLELGKGSMQNLPIAVPYVRGRRGF